jgi:hypothetical protein
MRAWPWVVLATLAGTTGCGGESSAEPVFPADWETALVEVRDCRLSAEHDLEYVRLFISPAWAEHFDRCVVPGGDCDEPFGEGALLVKPQYADPECSELVRLSVSLREEPASAPGPDGWRWQEATADGTVILDGAPEGCTRCHEACDDNYDLRCAMDP